MVRFTTGLARAQGSQDADDAAAYNASRLVIDNLWKE